MRPRCHDRLAIGRRFFKRDAGNALQLAHRAFKRDAEPFADEARIRLLKCERRCDPDIRKPPRQPAGDAPDIGERQPAEFGIDRRVVEQHADAGTSLVFLGAIIGDLGKRLGGGDADGNRDAGPLQHALPQRRPALLKLQLEAGQAEKGFVDRIQFKVGREVGEDAHHARAHIATERVVARAHARDLRAEPFPYHVPRLAHGDAERLGLIRAGDHTAVVVG